MLQDLYKLLKDKGRYFETAKAGDAELGPFKYLPGVWKNEPELPGRGWNMIALPFISPGAAPYRLLVNQYNETLTFSFVDKGVPNRGVDFTTQPPSNTDQLIVAIDYEQKIEQLAADDFPNSGTAGGKGKAIHHEPGLFLHMLNLVDNNLNIARLATIPHGDSVLGLGSFAETDGPPVIPTISGLPLGEPNDLNLPYLAPYKHYHDAPFLNLFDPTIPNALLAAANEGVNIKKTTRLDFDTTQETGGILNIPFVVRQANAASMRSTFWIQELDEPGIDEAPKLRLQYSQIVLLDFFGPRPDGMPGLIRWPHVSINTLVKVA